MYQPLPDILAYNNAIPIGIKTIATKIVVPRTPVIVHIGRHAGSFCCLNRESKVKVMY